MILHDIANRAGLVIEGPAALHAKILGHSDLDTINVVAIPEGFHEGIGKAEDEHIVDRTLAEVVVDAKNVLFMVGTVKNLVQRLGGGEVITERFFDDDARAFAAARLHQLFDDLTKKYRRNRQIVSGVLGLAEFLAQVLEGGSIVVIAVDIMEQAGKFFPRGGVEAAVFFEAVLGSGLQLIEIPAGLGYADDREVEMPSFQHGLERRKDLLVGQIAGCTKKDQSIGMNRAHGVLPFTCGYLPAAFSICPPNS